MQILRGVLTLPGRLGRPDEVEDPPMHVEHLLVFLDLVGVLEEIAHHPGVRHHHVDALHRLVRTHIGFSAPAAGATACAGAGRGLLSTSSLLNSTSAAPAPTSRMPSHSFQPGNSKEKWNGCPGLGCQIELTIVLMIGARPKINGAMNMR